MKNSDKSILHKEIKLLFSFTYWMSIDPYTGKVNDSLLQESYLEGKEKIGVIQLSHPTSDFNQVLSELPMLHYN